MPTDTTNVQLVKFCNEKIRPFDDLLVTLYQTAKSLLAAQSTQGLQSLYTRDTTPIVDGSAIDGRPPITGTDVDNTMALCYSVISWFEKGTLDGSGSVNNANVNTVSKITVNGKSLY